jgi:hypothetical protein
MSVLPVIPLFPLVFWAIAILMDRVVPPWGTTGIAGVHLLFAVILAGSIARDCLRMQRAKKTRQR